MHQRRLFWQFEAIDELSELLERRIDKDGVQDCIESIACLVAEEPGIAMVEPGPSHFLVHVFRCMDGDTEVFVRLIFDADDPVLLYVLSCRSVRF